MKEAPPCHALEAQGGSLQARVLSIWRAGNTSMTYALARKNRIGTFRCGSVETPLSALDQVQQRRGRSVWVGYRQIAARGAVRQGQQIPRQKAMWLSPASLLPGLLSCLLPPWPMAQMLV